MCATYNPSIPMKPIWNSRRIIVFLQLRQSLICSHCTTSYDLHKHIIFTYAIWEVASTSSSKLLIDVAWPEIAMEVQRHHSMAWNWKRILLPKLYKQNIAFVEITTCCAMGSKLRIVIIVEIQLYKVGICNEPLILRRKLLWHELSNHEIR